MKQLMIMVILTVLCGCMSADCFIAADADLQKGDRHRLYFKTLKIVQVCDDSVHVCHHSYDGLRICVIPLENDYVTDSYLRPGLYEYVGPFTYETIQSKKDSKRTNTIRLFKEVKE